MRRRGVVGATVGATVGTGTSIEKLRPVVIELSGDLVGGKRLSTRIDSAMRLRARMSRAGRTDAGVSEVSRCAVRGEELTLLLKRSANTTMRLPAPDPGSESLWWGALPIAGLFEGWTNRGRTR